MDLSKLPRYWYRLLRKRPAPRYAHLYRTIYRTGRRRILEVGVYDGVNAGAMIETALIRAPREEVFYYGFDLFEESDDQDLRRELSQRPAAETEVLAKLKSTRANIELHRGYTQETLPSFVQRCQKQSLFMDLIYIDGGHHFETVASDWSHCRLLMNERTITIFDDYFTEPSPVIGEVGCQNLVNGLDRAEYEVEILEPQDTFPKEWGILRTNFVRVQLKAGSESADTSDLPLPARR